MQRTLSVLIILVSLAVKAQIQTGIYGGLSVDLGNKQNRIGVVGGGYFSYDHIQLNCRAGGYYNFKSIGVGAKTWEAILGAGVVGAFGNLDSSKVMFNTLLDNNTFRKHSFGFSYQYYLDVQGTSQSTGSALIAIDKWRLVTENDLLGGKSGINDCYRTGAVQIAYQYMDFQFAWNRIFWTGRYKDGGKIRDDTIYPARKGYLDGKGGEYTDRSLGVSALEVRYKLRYQQLVSASLGIDSEYIRHGFQNWLMHDAYYVPKWMYGNGNLHIPMVAEDGSPFLFKEGQKVKPSSLYFEVGVNNEVFY